MSAMSVETSFQVTYDAQGRMLSFIDCDVSSRRTVITSALADRISFDGLSVDDLDFDHLVTGEDDPAGEVGRETDGEAGDEDGTGTGTVMGMAGT
jgi:hypothetical protein